MDGVFAEMLEEFMTSPLVTWVLLFDSEIDGVGSFSTQYLEVNSTCHDAKRRYLELTNGIFLNEVMRLIDPSPKVEQIYQTENNDEVVRVRNFSILNRHLRSCYEESLQQLILMPLPNVAVLGRDPFTEAAMEELRRLLLLMLGCAVQCERREEFIQRIQSLDIKTQAGIATCIQEVTQNPSAVLPLQWGELCALGGNELQGVFNSMAQHIQGLLAQRDTHLERIAELCQEHESLQGTGHSGSQSSHPDAPPQSLALQLTDSRAKLRRLRQELEDKCDQLLDYKQEVQAMEAELKKMRQENRALQGDMRMARGLRDELDCLRDRAAKVDRLQSELQNCTHRLRNLDLYRTQLQEQQQHCAMLQETRALLEEQLAEARARCSSLRELEKDNLLLRQQLINLEAERDTERQRVDELLEMNMRLEAELKQHLGQARRAHQVALESDEELGQEAVLPSPPLASLDLKPLSVEVSEASSWRLLGAENENMELRRRLEQLQAEREACVDVADSMRVNAAELVEVKEKLKQELEQETERRTALEKKHQDLMREFQNLKNENLSLRNSLESLKVEGQDVSHQMELGGKGSTLKEHWREEGEGRREAEGHWNGKGDLETSRETETGSIGTKREDGEGEEIFNLKDGKVKSSDNVKKIESKLTVKHSGNGKGKGGTDRTNAAEGTTEEEAPELFKLRENREKRREEEMLAPREETEGEEKGSSLDSSPLALQLHQALLEVEQKSQEVEKQASLAQELRSQLAEQIRRAMGAEQRLSVLEAEALRLRMAAESLAQARKQIEALQTESLQMEEELTRLRSQVELQRLDGAVMAQLQGERAQLERERDTLRGSVDSLRAIARKGDQLELTNQTLKIELERLGRNLDLARRREEELQVELQEAAQEAEGLARGRDASLLEVSRLEQEKEVCQNQLDDLRREQRQRERELTRLRHQLESTASALEHSNQRACSLEVEHRRVCQEVAQLKEDNAQMRELEEENRKLVALNKEDQARISSLSQELASEKLHSRERASQLTSEKIQLQEQLNQMTNEKVQSQERVSQLASQLASEELQSQELLSQLERLHKEHKRLEASLSTHHTDGSEGNTKTPVTPDEALVQNSIADSDSCLKAEPWLHAKSSLLLEALNAEQCQLSERLRPGGSSPRHEDKVFAQEKVTSQENAAASSENSERGEPLSMRLIEVERQNAALQVEKNVLLSQLSQSQSVCTHLQEQLDSLNRQFIVLQENCANLQALNTKLQTEQVSLSSQHATLWSRCSESEARVAALEAESKVWAKDREEVMMRGEGLRRDHERLTTLQQRQEAELETLLSKHSQLKATHRNLESQHRELEGRYKELLDCRTLLEEREEVIKMEREKMEREAQMQADRVREVQRLRDENERLHTQLKESAQMQTDLLAQGSVLRGELSAAQLERTRLEGELSMLREQSQQLELNYARLSSQYQLLTQLKGNMEEETRHLVEQNQNLARENRALLERNLESRDQHHQQQREFTDKLNELRREKQKLVEKIMDQYRILEPTMPMPSKAKKSNWIADRMKKLIKPRAGKEGREGRAHFIASGSIENLSEINESAPAPSTLQEPAAVMPKSGLWCVQPDANWALDTVGAWEEAEETLCRSHLAPGITTPPPVSDSARMVCPRQFGRKTVAPRPAKRA
ncbi:coiled-coil domain containing 88A isoform X2 [Scleropages formosus]|uniref:coiled-coil domain containing 88A isoform X2 n=1 Tax=Scleropages formosus TaxID=113540 RepID=UPI000878528C|nr:girdin-like isoform X2 [Scleropages formosus]